MKKRIPAYLIPILFFLAAFGLDKMLFIGSFPDTFLTTASFINFDHKERLIYELKDYLAEPERKKVIVMLGNSRTMSFDNSYIEENYPDWKLYNFSVPGGTTDYFYYLISRFKQEAIRPDHIFLAVSPQGFNSSARVPMDEVMINGLPLSFISTHAANFRLSDINNYIAKKIFWTYRFRPKLQRIILRLSDDRARLYAFRDFIEMTEQTLEEQRGSALYGVMEAEPDPDLLRANARAIWYDFFVPFTLFEGQMNFTASILETANQAAVPVTMVWVPVSPVLLDYKKSERVASLSHAENTEYYRWFQNNESDENQDSQESPESLGRTSNDAEERLTVIDVWKPAMLYLADTYGTEFLDLNIEEPLPCENFYDASHMAGICFYELTDRMMQTVRQ